MFVKGDPNINRLGRPKVARNLRAILKCFQDLKIDPVAGLPTDFKIPDDYEQFTLFEFRLVADMCKEAVKEKGSNKSHFSQMIIDRLYPSLKALDITSDGEKINERPINITVASADVAGEIDKAADSLESK